MKILAIAWNTFREAVRNKVLYTLVVVALGLIAGSLVLSQLTVGDPRKIVEDMGLASISFFSVLVSVLVGINLVAQEIQTRTIYTLLAKPISRTAFLLGKFAGLLLTVAVSISILGAAFVLLCAFQGSLRPALLLPLLLDLFECAIVIALALLFSSFSTPITSAFFTLALFLVGRTSWGLRLLEEQVKVPWQKTLCEVFYYALPELRKFDVRTEVVHGLPVASAPVLASMAYSVAYSAILLMIASAVLARRDFK